MLTLYTIGHSNQPLDAFLELVAAYEIRCLTDVRAFPSSRRWPHFNREALAASLAQHDVRYQWIPLLGGRRHGPPRPDSPHTAWTVAGFRNYADYMDSDDFGRGLTELLTLARSARTAFMCAEALHWRCHRRLISDRLVVVGHKVLHIETPTRAVEHHLPEFARIVDGRLIYDGGTQLEM